MPSKRPRLWGGPSVQNPDRVAGPALGPYSLDILCSAFGMTSFERDILLLCAGIELESDFSSLCASAQGDHARRYPTFGLALAAPAGRPLERTNQRFSFKTLEND